MPAAVPIETRRQRYAAEMLRLTGLKHPRVEQAFAAVAREGHLIPPPWTIFAPGGVFMVSTSDPGELYQDVLVVLDAKRGINNGQPSLHAAWMAALDPRPGETVVHVGAGTGYYTAILAELVAPGGQVHAYEIETELAEIAERNLAGTAAVAVHATSGVGAPIPACDVIYVNASASAPDAAWLRALRPAGRLIFPWQPSGRTGVALMVTRNPRGFAAAAIMEVAFIACVGAMTRPSAGHRPEYGEVVRTRSVWLTTERPPDDTATAIYDQVWFSSAPAERT